MSTSQQISAVAARAAERSETVARSRERQAQQAQSIVDAGRRLGAERGDGFTTQELVKEAGVSLQTFYRLFSSKDLLLLAVLESTIGDYCVAIDEVVRSLDDPVARLRMIVTSAVASVETGGAAGARFFTAQHWRLYQLFPQDVASAIQPFTELVARHAKTAAAEGLLVLQNPELDPWLVTQLVMAAFHHFAFTTEVVDADGIAEQLWQFCFAALGGQPTQHQAQGR